MLPKCLFSKNVRTQVTLPCHWLSITINTVRSSSNSSSSDPSSESDSDNDCKQKIRKQTVEATTSNSIAEDDKDNKFGELIDNLLKVKSSKIAHVKVNERNRSQKIEKQLSKAADTLTTVVGGNKERILSTLLESLSNIKQEKPFKVLMDEIATYKKNLATRYGIKETTNYNKNEIKEQLRKLNSQYRTKETWRFENKYTTGSVEDKGNNNVRKETWRFENKYTTGSVEDKGNNNVRKETWRFENKYRTGSVEDKGNNNVRKETLRFENKYRTGSVEDKGNNNVRKETLRFENKYRTGSVEDKGNNNVRKETLRFENKYRTGRAEDRENKNVTEETRNDGKTNKAPQMRQRRNSVIYSLLNEHREAVRAERHEKDEMKEYANIFTGTNTPSPNVPAFKVWNACAESELKVLQSYYPENAFQEMIQWTEEGILWKFPIDNEQGMEEEQSVHFSEHVFLERHLAGWCPSVGPIRHYMELVCVGLSKNPYMTVQEKYDHIMWYKNYFDDKKDLLKKLGLIDVAPSTVGKQIEAQ